MNSTKTANIKFVRRGDAFAEVFAGRKKIDEIASSQSDGAVSWEAKWAGIYESRDARSFASAECAIRSFVECACIKTENPC